MTSLHKSASSWYFMSFEDAARLVKGFLLPQAIINGFPDIFDDAKKESM